MLHSCLVLRRQEHYFDNPVNNALVTQELFEKLGSVKDKNRKEKPIQILVMDDIVGTQRTFNQLVTYLDARLGDFFKKIEIRFVFLFSPRQETIHDLANYLLSTDAHIIAKYKKVDFEMVTRKSELPYLKSIHYGDITKSSKTSDK